ncbi:MAG: CDP-alcohol phosphatidyltransferase family protein [Gammaproteobacteria bacterium]|nr:CDP-alcohol phosphatidyltransferase family protein [Gammaproteobacteria bacterium]
MTLVNEKMILLWATKNKDDEWWSSFVTSPLAIVANYFMVDIKWLSPNIITLLSFVIALISMVLIVIGGSVNFIIAAGLIQLSHVLDCMDGQMARYRKSYSSSGSYYDKFTDHLQVILWFGAVGYAAYNQSQSVEPIFLAFIGVAFFSLRGYVKYMYYYTQMENDATYLEQCSAKKLSEKMPDKAGISFSAIENIRWFFAEQHKILAFDEGVFIFMLSFALIFNSLTPMLWVFAISQLIYAIFRGLDLGRQLGKAK